MGYFDEYGKESGFFQRIRNLIPKQEAAATQPLQRSKNKKRPDRPSEYRLAGNNGITRVGGRVSQETPELFGNTLNHLTVFSNNSYWKKYALSESLSLESLQRIPVDKIAELLADISPEISQGLHIRTILSNTGYEIEALKLESDDRDEAAQKILDEIRARVAKQYGTEDVFYNQLFTTLWLRGSILAEAVFDEKGENLLHIATPDPKTLEFRKTEDEVLGTVNDFGQRQNGQFVSFRSTSTIRYCPFNPFPASIEGRPLISASFFISVFLMAVLRDLKRVIQQQGYPRYDIEIELEKLKNLMPRDAETNPQVFEEWAAGVRDTVISFIEDLEPDDTFVHFTGVKVNQPVGAMGTNSLTSLDGLFKGLERMAARALKVPPLFMGITDGVSEANANRQFEAFLKDLENGQHLVENGIAPLYQQGLFAQGIIARVKFRFATMRTSERLRDAQADMQEANLAAFCFDRGWINQDEAARRGAKVQKSDQPAPRTSTAALQTGATGAVDQGVNRGVYRMPTIQELAEARQIYKENAPSEFADLMNAQSETAVN